MVVLTCVIASSKIVGTLTGFYTIKSKGRSWFEDRKWLEQDWRNSTQMWIFFAEETDTAGISADAVRGRHRVLSNEVISMFTSSRLRTEFATLSGKAQISFDNIVGGLCRGWLNGSPIDFSLETLGASVG